MPELHRHQTLREHFKHPKDFRRILRNPKVGVFTFAWDETPENPNNPTVVVCFHPYGAEADLRLRVGKYDMRFEGDNPHSMGIWLGREVWEAIMLQDGWDVWSPEETND